MKKLFLAVGFIGLMAGCKKPNIDCTLKNNAQEYTITFNNKGTEIVSYRTVLTTAGNVAIDKLQHYNAEGLTIKYNVSFRANEKDGSFTSENVIHNSTTKETTISGTVDTKPVVIYLENNQFKRFVIDGQTHNATDPLPVGDILTTYRDVFSYVSVSYDLSKIYTQYNEYPGKDSKSLKDYYVDTTNVGGNKFICS